MFGQNIRSITIVVSTGKETEHLHVGEPQLLLWIMVSKSSEYHRWWVSSKCTRHAFYYHCSIHTPLIETYGGIAFVTKPYWREGLGFAIKPLIHNLLSMRHQDHAPHRHAVAEIRRTEYRCLVLRNDSYSGRFRGGNNTLCQGLETQSR